MDFAVYEADPSIFYAASASGGLLKTVNAGVSWENVFDRQSTVSIGDVAINHDDPNIVWVGTGEANNRQSSSWGDGLHKSTDGGHTWTHKGLRESHHIGRIVVHPLDTDVVYVAAVGRLWGPNPERGVFKTTDGGNTWEHVLAIDENTGAIDLAMDPLNPKTLYAAAYARRRSGWGFNGGSKTGGIFKSVDCGRTWRELTEGLQEGPTGRIGLRGTRGSLGDATLRPFHHLLGRSRHHTPAPSPSPSPPPHAQIRCSASPANPAPLIPTTRSRLHVTLQLTHNPL